MVWIKFIFTFGSFIEICNDGRLFFPRLNKSGTCSFVRFTALNWSVFGLGYRTLWPKMIFGIWAFFWNDTVNWPVFSLHSCCTTYRLNTQSWKKCIMGTPGNLIYGLITIKFTYKHLTIKCITNVNLLCQFPLNLVKIFTGKVILTVTFSFSHL